MALGINAAPDKFKVKAEEFRIRLKGNTSLESMSEVSDEQRMQNLQLVNEDPIYWQKDFTRGIALGLYNEILLIPRSNQNQLEQ